MATCLKSFASSTEQARRLTLDSCDATVDRRRPFRAGESSGPSVVRRSVPMKILDVQVLELRHRTLDREIHKLDRRGAHMTPRDRERATELKKRRLATKDQLYALAHGK
jgi:uncharacterized protein YdcH (DUF465 family)